PAPPDGDQPGAAGNPPAPAGPASRRPRSLEVTGPASRGLPYPAGAEGGSLRTSAALLQWGVGSAIIGRDGAFRKTILKVDDTLRVPWRTAHPRGTTPLPHRWSERAR